MKPSTFLTLFFIVAALHLGAIVSDISMLRFITKPLLMLTLGVYFILATKGLSSTFTKRITLGIFFSMVGDTLLMFDGTGFFIGGIGGFLLAQVSYASAFAAYPNFTKGILFKKVWWAIPILIYAVSLDVFLWPSLGDFKIPVLAYSVVIACMALSALNLNGRISKSIFISLFIGVLLFLLSDSIIAINKFASDQLSIPKASLIIMSTYIIAQYLIVTRSVRMITK